MKILILLSTYNGEKFLSEQINSILLQKNVVIGLLVRDDGSSDATMQILQEFQSQFPNIHIEKGHNIGCVNSYMWLLDAAYKYINEYDYFAFSDQDDVWLPEKLFVASQVLNKMDKNQPCMYCSNLRVVDSSLNGVDKKWKSDETFITPSQSMVCSMATGCTMVFNNRVIDIYHHNPPQKIGIHDLWIMHMCMFLGYIHYDKDSYILYRQHSGNVIGAKTTIKAKLQSRWRSLKNIIGSHENENEAKELLRCYSNILTPTNIDLISAVAYYRTSIKRRISFLFGLDDVTKGIRRKHDDIFLRLRIIIGCV